MHKGKMKAKCIRFLACPYFKYMIESNGHKIFYYDFMLCLLILGKTVLY